MERKPYASSAKTLSRYAEIVEAVQQDVGGIGCASMNLAQQKGIAAVRINRVTPDPVSINRGTYPYSRALWLFTRKKAEPPAARAFVDFIISRAGQRVLSDQGFVQRFEQSLWRIYEW